MSSKNYLLNVAVYCLAASLFATASGGVTLEFQLLCWDDTQATTALPSAAGRKPSATMPTAGDWLVFTADDVVLAAANNPSGAVSHNFVDITGAGGAGFNLAPSLSGILTLELNEETGSQWRARIVELDYMGHANAMQVMNQFLVTAGSPAASNSAFLVDGMGNSGQWTASATNNWAIQYTLDFYLATNADGDPSATDVDATFNDQTQMGFLIPLNHLTTEGLASVSLNDPLGFYGGDLEQYVLEQIVPRVPANATYLLVTQMNKTPPVYAEPGLPITTNSQLGNTTVAYTTQTLTTPPHITTFNFVDGQPGLRFTGSSGQSYAIQHSTNLTDWQTVNDRVFTNPEPGIVEWRDSNPTAEQRFYRVLALTP